MKKDSLYHILRYRILIAVLIFNYCSDAVSQDYQKSFLSVKDGLSQNEVTSIIQDDYGFMWFGTRGGLNRYNGYAFNQYKPSFEKNKSLSNPSVESLLCSTKGDIWVGTKSGGVSVFDYQTETFHSPYKNRVPNRVISLFEDTQRNMWIGSWASGLQTLGQNDSLSNDLGNDRINSMLITPDSTVWVAVNSGLKYKRIGEDKYTTLFNKEITAVVMDPDAPYLWLLGWKQELTRLNYNDFTSTTFINDIIEDNTQHKSYSLLLDRSGGIWIGTWGNGCYKFDRKNKIYSKIDLYPKVAFSSNIDYDVVLDIFEDKVGDIWCGTHAGVVRLSSKTRFFYVDKFKDEELVNPHVSALFVDSNKGIWAGTQGRGLFYSSDFKEFNRVSFSRSVVRYKEQEVIVKKIVSDKKGNIWVSINEGVFIVKKYGNRTELVTAATFFNSPDLRKIIKAHVLSWQNDFLWVGTQQKGAMLFKLVEGKYQYVRSFQSGPNNGQIGDNRVVSIEQDKNENLWFATYKGMFRFNTKDSSFISVEEMLPQDNKLLCDIVLCSCIDSNNNLWFGTPCSLNKLDFKENKVHSISVYTRQDGLADDYINAIQEDEKGNIWVSTNVGISELNAQTEEIRNYNENDGIGGDGFSENASCVGANGTILFGGYSSLSYFNPNEIETNHTKPNLVITKFSVLNQEVPISTKGILNENINDIEELIFTHKESEFSFQLASLDFKASYRNQYAYKLEGYNNEWINIGSRRHISFSNLRPGEYTLHIKGSNSNGVWNEQKKSIRITMLPAPWKSVYAVVAYIILIMIGVILISKVGIRQERLKNSIKLEKIQRVQEHDMNEYKLKFFTNISHELRTPLTLILAPVNELLKKEFSKITSNYFTDNMKLIHQNTNRLYNLVNQLLEFRKIEAGKIKLEVSENDPFLFVNEICKPFIQLASINNVSFKIENETKEKELYFDVERMGIVFNNLLSNAFKYAGNLGKVKVLLRETESLFYFDLSNTGKTVSEEEINHLFERFYQSKESASVSSSGIGLELVKNYINLHKGQVTVSSDEGYGTTFSVALKKGKDHFSSDQLVQKQSKVDLPDPGIAPSKAKTINTGTKGAKVLVVEDNQDVRDYLVSLLSEFYELVEAEDGLLGYEKAVEVVPDIIISDVMMPRMDGYEFCQKVKTNDLISHIPIILLTAKSSDKDQLFGTRKGADVYLNKPFDPELLLEKMRLLISTRKKLEEKFSRKVLLEPRKAQISNEEEVFLKKSIDVIEKNIGNSKFDPDHLATEMAMSSSTFYRKIKRVTSQTPGEFIKSIRLKRAAQLLKDSNLTVSEIIENVGYLDIRNFRKNFKEAYNDTPANYRKENK